MKSKQSKHCASCNKPMEYNFRYECYECDCGKVYNAIGQELRPISDWKDEYDEDDR